MSLPAELAARVRAVASARGVWFWTAFGTVSAVLLLWAGSQLAKANGQNVDWYTGFGQWLGALGSLIAAVVALWIATTDRQRADQARRAEREEADKDLAREAGLVRVETGHMKAAVVVMPTDSRPGIAIDNRRSSCIYDIEVVRIVKEGAVIPDPEFHRQIRVQPSKSEWAPHYSSLKYFALEPNHLVMVYPKGPAENQGEMDEPPEYVAVRYTDQSGRRWEVDSDGGPARKVA